ncbi:MAG: hypothetical protein CW346_04800 [Bacillaceae bacterium]|nr:hypothetical protein [Bacillaceae bacterium]
MGPDPGKPLYRSAAAGSPAAVPLILRPSEIRFCPMENRGGTEKKRVPAGQSAAASLAIKAGTGWRFPG